MVRFWRLKQMVKLYQVRMQNIRKWTDKALVLLRGLVLIEGEDLISLLTCLSSINLEANMDEDK